MSWLEKHYSKRYKFENLIDVSEKGKRIELRVKRAQGTIEDVYFGSGPTKKLCKIAAARRFMQDKHKKKKLPQEEAFLQSSDASTTVSVSTSLNGGSDSSSSSSSSSDESDY